MFDLKWIRDNAQAFDAALKTRGAEPVSARVLELDAARRAHVNALQEAQNRRNAASREIGKHKAEGNDAAAQKLIDELAELKAFIQQGEEEERRLDGELNDLLAQLPNLPLEDVPVGADEKANEEVRRVGKPPRLGFEPKQHFEIGEALGLMDFEAAAKMSGARFVVLKGALARLERAIASFMLDMHTEEFGYTETLPPALVRDEALFGTGQLPKFKEDQFIAAKYNERAALLHEALDFATEDERQNYCAGRLSLQEHVDQALDRAPLKEDFWLIPTAEVPLTNLVRESILDEASLPMRFTAWTPCFRAEAGAAGKDTRGMIRQHQFSKVELVSITTPEQSLEELERMRNCAEEVLIRLDLPFRTMVLSTGDMGFAARKTYDLEVWLPGQEAYREISSCSLCGDFQARRMQARYRSTDNPKAVRHVHTLNGSGLAVGRTMIAILENYQQDDGCVIVPEVLRPYMGGMEKITSLGGRP